jgi:C4-dicarboxylate transporter DctM subunit
LAIAVLAIIALPPLVEIVGREGFGHSVPGTIPIVQHMTLWITFLGAALAARSDRLLALSTGTFLPERWRPRVQVLTAMLAVGVTSCLFVASVQLVRVDYQYTTTVAWGIPVWGFSVVMPLGFAVIAGRLIWHAGTSWRGRVLAAVGASAPLVFGLLPAMLAAGLVLPVGVVIIVGTALGMPIYAAIGGAALLLFWNEGTPISAVPGETYRLSTSPMLPAIPLFTLSGYILAEGGASQRLLRLCAALVGWLPGGLAIVVTLVLAFFTPLTGASGITILAMGGLLLPMLVEAQYSERQAVGLVTVSGAIGVLLPPSLPVILYAYYAELPLDRLFIAGLLPGFVLIVAVAAWGAWRGWRGGAVRTPFRLRELGRALWEAKWEVALPVVILAGIFGGFVTLVEAAALTVLYAVVVECVVFRELRLTRDVTRVAVESATLVGGFMIILSVALGLTSYLIIAQIPMYALAWVREFIHSPYLFLLALNVLLIIVGALMDIYSAIIVIVPLVAPMAAAYAIDPIHLGVIFLANMQLGYLMPPMGENLFLSAYRFDQPLGRVYRSTFPYVVILLLAVLLITYVPPITLWLVRISGV